MKGILYLLIIHVILTTWSLICKQIDFRLMLAPPDVKVLLILAALRKDEVGFSPTIEPLTVVDTGPRIVVNSSLMLFLKLQNDSVLDRFIQIIFIIKWAQ